MSTGKSLTTERRALVVFACVKNAGRSQMAAALFNTVVDPSRAHAISAGTEPAAAVHPEVATVMAEVGIDLSQSTPRRLTPEVAAGATHVITMGCGESCPFIPGAVRDDWPLPDPHGRPLDEVRHIRDEIARRAAAFAMAHGWAK